MAKITWRIMIMGEYRLKCCNSECKLQKVWLCGDDITPCPYCGQAMVDPTKWQDSDKIKCLLKEIELLTEELSIHISGYIYVYRLSDNKFIWGGRLTNVTINEQ